MKNPNDKRILAYYLIFHFILWSLLPLLRGVIPLDSLEAISWGKSFVFITDKHPPISGWIAYYFYLLCGKIPESVYILSQIFIIAGFIYIYNLARLLLPTTYALLAVIATDTIIYYNFTSVEYNVNVILLFIFPALSYHFYRALNSGSTIHWILSGIYAGLGVLDKYYIFMLLGAIFVYICYIRAWGGVLKNRRFYYGLLAFGIIIAPHIFWIFKSDFVTIHYFIRRGGSGADLGIISFITKHLWYPIRFFLSQFILALPILIALLIYKLKYKTSLKHNSKINQGDCYSPIVFINFMCFAPLLLTMLVSVISGSNLRSMWGTPLFFVFGIWLFYYFRIKQEHITRFFIPAIAIIQSLIVVAFVAMVTITPSLRVNIDKDSLVMQSQEFWDKHTDKSPLYYTGGDMWLGSIVAIEAESKQNQKIRTFIELNPKKNFWVNDEILSDIENKGILVFGSLEDIRHYEKQYPNLIFHTQELEIKSKSLFGKSKSSVIYISVAKMRDSQPTH